MASLQVLPKPATSTRKQADLEAGKRKLEEFRKKRAKGRDKKAASTGQLQLADLNQYEQLSQENQQMGILDSNANYNKTTTEPFMKTESVFPHGSQAISSADNTDLGLSNGVHPFSHVLVENYNASYGDPLEKPGGEQEPKWQDGSGYPGSVYDYYDRWGTERNELSFNSGTDKEITHGIAPNQHTASDSVNTTPEISKSVARLNFYSSQEAQLEENGIFSKEYSFNDLNISDVSGRSRLLDMPSRDAMQNKVESSRTTSNHNAFTFSDGPGVEQYDSVDFDQANILDMGAKKHSGFKDRRLNGDSVPWQTSESLSAGFSFDFGNSSNQIPLRSTISEPRASRSRPSFLDSLNVPKVSSVSHLPFTESEKSEPLIRFKSSMVHGDEKLSSAASQSLFTEPGIVEPFMKFKNTDALRADDHSSLNSSYLVNLDGESMRKNVKDDSLQRQHEFSVHTKSEDFAALEQHIEDLTQEKFSLQRALDASRTLAESLAVENSSLTESFNQQGAVVNELKSDLERLQEEIRAQLLALDAVKMEYTNAQLECNAADERAKILASEVIGLEEKALRLRSNELKLEKQLENSNSEISSYKKKASSLERERRDLQSTIDALQEEKKLLLFKIRKASANGKAADVSKRSSISKDASTSTEDLGAELLNQIDSETSAADTMPSVTDNVHEIEAPFPSSGTLSSPSLARENRLSHLPDASVSIPPDQLRTIGNIDSLISELALEKEELVRSLAVESSNSAMLKDLNKELSQKLEAQTQRLELLIAQNMAHDSAPVRQMGTHIMHEGADYADEGDEVVERVLGWIMKLFPGGPSKRRTSKLL